MCRDEVLSSLILYDEVLHLLVLAWGCLSLPGQALQEVLDALVALGLGQVGDGAGGALAKAVPGKIMNDFKKYSASFMVEVLY